MRVELLCVPYDSGMRGARMGAGPERLLSAGVVDRLKKNGHDVGTTMVRLPTDAFLPEVQAAFELDRRLAGHVKDVIALGAFPLVLAGNCITSVGTIAGIGEPELGIAWFDAHGDFNTPETTTGGFLDGMALAIATGRCWQQLAASVPGFTPVAEHRVSMFGTRDLDPQEMEMFAESGIDRVITTPARADQLKHLSENAGPGRDVYLHVDLDVLDPSEGKANGYAAPGGLSVPELRRLVEEIAARFRVRAAAITAYDPSFDDDGRVAEAGIGTIVATINAVAKFAVPSAAKGSSSG